MEPAKIKQTILDYDQGKKRLSDLQIDRILGIPTNWENGQGLADIFGNEQFTYEGTPYNFLRAIYRFWQFNSADSVYDLGSGYGRVVIYGAIVSPAKFTGIELVPERASICSNLIDKLNLRNLACKRENIIESNFEDGNVFYLFNPFTNNTLKIVGEKLKKMASTKRIKVITWGGPSNSYFNNCDWLKESGGSEFPQIQYFESN